jgi:hypothetical protein
MGDSHGEVQMMLGTFPNLMMLTKVHPIHKRGGKQISNYRPTSVLPLFFSKILEI